MKEQKIHKILTMLIDGNIKTSEVARLTGLSERQIYRKKKAFNISGISSIPHKSRYRPSGRGYSPTFKRSIIDLYLSEYSDWNFYHNIEI